MRPWRRNEVDTLLGWMSEHKEVVRGRMNLWCKQVKDEAFKDNEEISWKKIKDKYHNMRRQWILTRKMCHHPGYRIREDSVDDHVRAVILGKCPDFFQLEAIFVSQGVVDSQLAETPEFVQRASAESEFTTGPAFRVHLAPKPTENADSGQLQQHHLPSIEGRTSQSPSRSLLPLSQSEQPIGRREGSHEPFALPAPLNGHRSRSQEPPSPAHKRRRTNYPAPLTRARTAEAFDNDRSAEANFDLKLFRSQCEFEKRLSKQQCDFHERIIRQQMEMQEQFLKQQAQFLDQYLQTQTHLLQDMFEKITDAMLQKVGHLAN